MNGNLTSHAKEWAGSDMSVLIFFETLSPTKEELIIFTSKDSTNISQHPVLRITTTQNSNVSNQPSFDIDETPYSGNTIKLMPTDDAFIGLDFTNPNDSFGLRTLNSGNEKFLKVWYAFNVTEAEELIVTVANMKFDLSEINPNNVINADLKLHPYIVSSSGGGQIIAIFDFPDNDWKESTVTFDNGPGLSQNEISFTNVNEPNRWYAWNVTDFVKDNAGSNASLSLAYKTVFLGHEEQTVFNSKEALDNQPYLEIVYDEPKNGGGCLIATAAYGSELAPQVQHLRELRDNHLLQTSYGSVFMTGFNQFYYSFSPTIADLERENPIFKELVKLGITPLISSLSLLNYADLDSEYSVLGYGLSIIALNVGIYFVSPFVGLKVIKIYFLRGKKIHHL